ncbi:MAG: septum formation initiator family protein [Sediminibacterium sp.]|nr:septum formation initiator family protein [Hydrotalea sp.]MCU0336232.1 septum formation initiator family protein [Sediminibacterium sp.]
MKFKWSKLINVYTLTLLGCFTWMLFFDEKNFFEQRERKKELDLLLKKKAYYESAIEQTRKELNDLQNNPDAIEKFARERYFMKKQGEEIFVVEDPS